MHIHNLPQDIFPADSYPNERIIFHNYAAGEELQNGKSILHTNAISLVMSGEKIMRFANRTLHINNSEFHFISAGNCLASIKFSGRDIFRSILIFFENSVLTDFYLKYDGLIKEIRQAHKIKSEPYVSFKKNAFTRNFITSLDLLLQNGKSVTPEMRLVKFEELMLHLLEKYPREVLSFQASGIKDLDDLAIKRAVESNITSNISLEDLAFLCNISLSTFKRRFEKIYGTSPSKWMLQQRMELAKHLLLNHQEKPGEVYYKVGYENHSSFSQSFRQYFGVAPKDLQLQNLTV